MFILLTLNLSHSLQSFIVTWRLPTRMSQPSVGLSSVSPGESHSHGKFPWSSKRGHRLDCLWSGRKLVWLPRWLSNIPRFDKSVNTIMSWPTWMVYMFYNGTHIYIYIWTFQLGWFIWFILIYMESSINGLTFWICLRASFFILPMMFIQPLVNWYFFSGTPTIICHRFPSGFWYIWMV